MLWEPCAQPSSLFAASCFPPLTLHPPCLSLFFFLKVPVARLIARGALRPGNEANGLGVKHMLLSTEESPCQNTSPEEAAAAAAAQQPVSGSAWATPQRTWYGLALRRGYEWRVNKHLHGTSVWACIHPVPAAGSSCQTSRVGGEVEERDWETQQSDHTGWGASRLGAVRSGQLSLFLHKEWSSTKQHTHRLPQRWFKKGTFNKELKFAL